MILIYTIYVHYMQLNCVIYSRTYNKNITRKKEKKIGNDIIQINK